jgi:hypothetical protein
MYLLCCNAWEEPREHEKYEDAIRELDEYTAGLESDGWEVEHGWASRDNLPAARALRDSGMRFVQVVIDQSDDDDGGDPTDVWR